MHSFKKRCCAGTLGAISMDAGHSTVCCVALAAAAQTAGIYSDSDNSFGIDMPSPIMAPVAHGAMAMD